MNIKGLFYNMQFFFVLYTKQMVDVVKIKN
jgi:hypothetical protein